MARAKELFTTIRTEGALLPADLLQRISEGATIDGLTPESYHRTGEKLNEAINRSWNVLQGAWASFKAAQERLPDGDLGTTITRERWLLPLFRELDYGRLQTANAVEIDGRSYPVSHGWEHVPIHLVSYKLEIDKRTPGATGAASASPHSLLQVFLNRSDAHLWGFVSNGYKLRILRDNVTLTRQAYVEFDLEAMMEGEVYSDFVLLWLLCHQSRVEGERPAECWLEKWMKTAEEQGTRALDQLRDGVQQAIEAFGRGFLAHHANATLRDSLTHGQLNAQDYYRQLLRMVYRLLFLFVAEDRDLLLTPDAPQDVRERYIRYYSTQHLRHMAERFKGTRHSDVFEGLRLVMRLLSGDKNGAGSGLGLVPLGSFLFSDAAVADIIDCQINNQHLLDAIRALSLTYDQRAQVWRTVDYKNLGADELGSVFESLLELHPQINVGARDFALATAAGNERKTTGSYYTPESLVHALLDSALDPVLEDAVRGTGKALTPSPSSGENTLTASPSGGENTLTASPSGGENTLTASPSGGENTLTPNPSPSGRGGQEPVWRVRASEAMAHIARDLRQRQTPAETILWEALRDRRLDGLKFRRQHAIGNTAYVADFLCYEARLVIELDGEIHQQQKMDDAIRQQNIEAEGYTVIRFKNEQIYQDLITVLTHILTTARRISPLPEGEGLGVRVHTTDKEGLGVRVHTTDKEGLGVRVHTTDKERFRAGTTAEQRILNLKICDPACGSGHFLIAAANRIAKRLAQVRTGEEEPAPEMLHAAKRDVISHCIYGVDINPMAVELCKVNLWMEALDPGKPLNFLDHRIQVGNSLMGTTPKLMADGIPDDAFNPIEGDDPKYVSALKKQNKQERHGQKELFDLRNPELAANYAHLTETVQALDSAPEDSLDDVRLKEARYAALADDPEYIKARLLADAWCAAFVWEKKPSPPQSPSPSGRGGSRADIGGTDASGRGVSNSLLPEGEGLGMRVPPLTDLLYRRMEDNALAENLQPVRETVVQLKERYQFFHWHVAFPDVFTVDPHSPAPSLPQGERGVKAPLPEGEGFGVRVNEGYNPHTGWHGGFDVVLGNPPWERIKIQEKEWFAERAPQIASAPNAAARRRMIDTLKTADPTLYAAFRADLRQAEGESHFVRVSQRYPLCGRGDVNTYTLFAETARHIVSGDGRAGIIVPSGIATDDTTKFFFQDLMQKRALVSLYDFENREKIFLAVDSRMKFALVTMRGDALTLNPSPKGRGTSNRADSLLHLGEGPGMRADSQFAFFLHNVADLTDPDRVFTLSADDIAALNPNTGTMATFRSVRDAEITKAIYRRIPVLIYENKQHSGVWGVGLTRMFHMSDDAELFITRKSLEDMGAKLHQTTFLSQSESFLPLYEGKMFHQFDHRWSSYVSDTETVDLTIPDKELPDCFAFPRYWIQKRDFDAKTGAITSRNYWMVYRKTTNATNERTALVSIIPLSTLGDRTPLILFDSYPASLISAAYGNFCSFVYDYNARQKVSGVDMSVFHFVQLPVIPPHTYTPALLDFIVPRVLELTYTAWDLQAFAQDVGYHGAPFVWDEARRFLMRCELDALYFHLYQIPREDVDYIMETFPIVKRKDEAAHGEYLTKRIILEMYDQMAGLPVMLCPHPKSFSQGEKDLQSSDNLPSPLGRGDGGEGLYPVPDVRQWETWLSPPPASPDVAHHE